VSSRAPHRTLLTALLLLVALGVGVPTAAAGDCGKQVISAYFNTGKIGYHSQACYASALVQVDPDARMYSGIMGAIRAARARDLAADQKAAQPAPPVTDTAPPPPSTATAAATTTSTSTTATVIDPPLSTAVATAVRPASGQAELSAQAAATIAAAQPGVPLPVILLGGAAVLLAIVGLGALAVRYVDRDA
jgi:hypothetical protein